MSFSRQPPRTSVGGLRWRRRRRLVLVLGCLPVAVLLALSLVWLWSETRLDHRLDALVDQARRDGWQLRLGASRRGGWPLRATRVLDDTALAPPPLATGRLVWTAQHLTLALPLLDPTHIRLTLSGLQTLGRPGTTLRQRLRLQADGLTLLALPYQAGQAARLALRSGALRLALPGEPPVGIGAASGLLRWTTSGMSGGVRHDGQALSLQLDRIELPGLTGPAGSASLTVALPGPRGDATLDWRDRLATWRDGGGRLLIEAATLRLPDCRIALTGDARLDGDFQPYGDFTARIWGADNLIDNLDRAGWLDRPAAQAVRAVIGLISDAGSPGPVGAGTADSGPRASPVELPLLLRGGVLLLGRIPLLRLPLLSSSTP